MKAYLIARVSTEDQADALPAQEYRLTDYAERMSYQYEIIKIRESAYSGDRKQFRSVVDAIEAETQQVVVVFDKVDRLTRDPTSEEYIRLVRMCNAGAIELHFCSDLTTITKNSPATIKMILSLGVGTAQYYSSSISDNVKRRQAQMLRDGIWTGAAPIGYRYTSLGGKKWIVPHEVASGYIKQTFRDYANGFTSLKEIAKAWGRNYGIKTPHSRIENILKNPFYRGTMRVKNKLYEHHYEPLISKELFDKVQARLHGYQAKPHRWSGLPFAYRGLITCSECGCAVTFEIKKQKYIYGHCTQTKYHHNASYISEKNITDQFAALLKRVCIPDDVLRQVHGIIEEQRLNQQDRIERQSRLYAAEIQKYQTRLEKMYDDRLSGLITDEIYSTKYTEFTKKQADLKVDLQRLELLDNSKIKRLSYLLELANRLPELFTKAKIDEKRKILSEIYSNLCLNKDLLEVKYKKPFDLMAFCNENSSWQGLQDDYRTYCGIVGFSKEE